jgi:hypothetical protein
VMSSGTCFTVSAANPIYAHRSISSVRVSGDRDPVGEIDVLDRVE